MQLVIWSSSTVSDPRLSAEKRTRSLSAPSNNLATVQHRYVLQVSTRWPTSQTPMEAHILNVLSMYFADTCEHIARTTAITELSSPQKQMQKKLGMRYFVNVDNAVESTILSTLANHLKSTTNEVDSTKNHPGPWSHCIIDLSGAKLTEFVDFSGVTIKKINCQEVRFERTPSFHGTTFMGEATFREAIFPQNTSFRNTIFRQYATFRGATFQKYTNFSDATFIKDASFRGASFGQAATFRGCTFMQQAHYIGTTFKNDAKFVRATFTLDGNFYNATFMQHAHFHGATFGKTSSFRKTIFKQNVTFLEITIKKQAKFIFHQAKFNPTYRKRIRFPSSFALIDGIPKEAEWERDNEVFSPGVFVVGEGD